MRTDDNFKSAVIRQVEIERIVKNIVTDPLLLVYYIIFGKEAVKLARKHKGDTLLHEIEILQRKWIARGLDILLLDGIKDALNVPYDMALTEAWLNARYLRLDCTNTPLTGLLTSTGGFVFRDRCAIGNMVVGQHPTCVLHVYHQFNDDADNTGITCTVRQMVPTTNPNYPHSLRFEMNYYGSGAAAYRLGGIYGTVNNMGVGNIDGARGVVCNVTNHSSGNINSAIASRATISTDAASTGIINISADYGTSNTVHGGNITNLATYWAENPQVAAPGTITNLYGMVLPNLNTATTINQAYTQTGTQQNVLAGPLSVKTPAATQDFAVQTLPVHADNAAAKLAGLVDGDMYRTGDIVKVVHP